MVLSFCYNLAHEVGSNAVLMYPGYLSVAEWLGSLVEAVHALILNFPLGGASGKILETAATGFFWPVCSAQRALEAGNRLCEPYMSQIHS